MAFLNEVGLQHFWNHISEKIANKVNNSYTAANEIAINTLLKSEADSMPDNSMRFIIIQNAANGRNFNAGSWTFEISKYGVDNAAYTAYSTVSQQILRSNYTDAQTNTWEETSLQLDTTLTLADYAADSKAVGDAINEKSVVAYDTDNNGNIVFQSYLEGEEGDDTIHIDATLTIEGSAADAKAVGDRFTTVEDEVYGRAAATHATQHAIGGSDVITPAMIGADPAGTARTEATNALNSAKSYTDESIADLINSAPATLDTLGEIATAMQENINVVEALEGAISNKAAAVHTHTPDEVGLSGGEVGQILTKTSSGVAWEDAVNKFDYILLKDQENGYDYVMTMQGGSIVTYLPTVAIEVTTLPKTNYSVGETFDASGMVVKAKQADNNSNTITDYTVNVPAFNAAGQYYVTVSYTELDKTYTTDFICVVS